MNDASMKLEAIKAIRAVNEQLIDLKAQAEEIKKILKNLENEGTTLQTQIVDTHNKIDKLFVSKRQQAAEHQDCLKDYDEFLSTLDSVNSRLDAMAKWRKKASVRNMVIDLETMPCSKSRNLQRRSLRLVPN